MFDDFESEMDRKTIALQRALESISNLHLALFSMAILLSESDLQSCSRDIIESADTLNRCRSVVVSLLSDIVEDRVNGKE